jgi:hypothetical protein
VYDTQFLQKFKCQSGGKSARRPEDWGAWSPVDAKVWMPVSGGLSTFGSKSGVRFHIAAAKGDALTAQPDHRK